MRTTPTVGLPTNTVCRTRCARRSVTGRVSPVMTRRASVTASTAAGQTTHTAVVDGDTERGAILGHAEPQAIGEDIERSGRPALFHAVARTIQFLTHDRPQLLLVRAWMTTPATVAPTAALRACASP